MLFFHLVMDGRKGGGFAFLDDGPVVGGDWMLKVWVLGLGDLAAYWSSNVVQDFRGSLSVVGSEVCVRDSMWDLWLTHGRRRRWTCRIQQGNRYLLSSIWHVCHVLRMRGGQDGDVDRMPWMVTF